MDIAKGLVFAGALALMGCTPTWYNPNFSSQALHERQLAIDSAGCNSYALGAAPMPSIRVYSPQPQNYTFNGTVSTYGSGGYSSSRFSGTATQMPMGSFSSGFAQGAALGEAINAKRARDMAFKACMYQLGWTDSKPEGLSMDQDSGAGATAAAVMQPAAVAPEVEIPGYTLNAKQEWEAEVDEFLDIFDQYVGDGPQADAFGKALKARLEAQGPVPMDKAYEGHGILLGAEREVRLLPQNPDRRFSQQVYRQAAAGDGVAQFALVQVHLKGIEGKSNRERALYWCTRAAQAGNEDAIAYLALFYAEGDGVKQDYGVAYRLIKAAQDKGSPLAGSALRKIEAKLTTSQAAAYRRAASL